MIVCSRSTLLYLFLNGKLEDIIAPWNISVDFEKEIITIKKRNWYFIGINENVHAFRFIRSINVHNRIFGADLEITSFGNRSKALCLPKNEATQIKQALIEYNQHKKGGFIITWKIKDVRMSFYPTLRVKQYSIHRQIPDHSK